MRCSRCRLTYYCDVDHQKADWVSIHEKICQLLIPVRTSLPSLTSEEERKYRVEQLVKRQVCTRRRNTTSKRSHQRSFELLWVGFFCVCLWDAGSASPQC
uniref:MYND-type domain-containing protein n=1 Tax=Phasianus colchicus TaxID=9054 RepID=A0A669QTA6_PHACC